MLLSEPNHIIAIGASAGGLEEIKAFFDHTPLDGVCYVIVQHLSPDFKSRMAELLAKHSQLLVKEAENGVLVQINEVYIIPNDKFMTISNQRLYLTDKDEVKGPHLTINMFFNSLAMECGDKAIGVILSGLGSDGSEGIMAIKNAGGMVIVRNPETTEFSSMPSHAVETGVVDYILEPESMPDAIENYIDNKPLETASNEQDIKTMAAITKLIKERSPLDFTDYKQATILRRIKRRATRNNFLLLEKYYEFLVVTPEEVEALAKDFLISVTSFFRDKEAFAYIKEDILPGIINKLGPDEDLKIWVAACATGEEAYSMAIIICEQLEEASTNATVKIFATDIDSDALAFAGKGVYGQGISKDVSAERLEKYFIKEYDNYRIKPAIRKMVIFAKHDLVKNPPYCNMQLISCRNMLIYMTPVLQKKIFLMLLFGLRKDGYLFLGSSESPQPIIQNLQVEHKKWKIYKNLETKRAVSFDSFSFPVLNDVKPNTSFTETNNTNSTKNSGLIEAINTTLVNDMDSLVVCIDENNQVIQTYGDTTKFLLQKNFNSNIEELLPTSLAVAFNILRGNALKSNKKVSVSGIESQYEQSLINVCLSVSPLIINKGEQKMLMVTFSEVKNEPGENIVFDEKLYFDEYTTNMKEELKEVREKLANVYLQLHTSNENMQSFNEELLSANEEMQSTNEEMQSVNEELHTINIDYDLKNKELVEINDDLNNYFRSNLNGQLFVNNDLLLMKFSPGTVKQINLLPSDIGRPLSNISTNIKFETIEDDIKRVIAEGVVITKEIETNNGKWYQVMTMPYVQQTHNTNNGAIITFNDITELKAIQLELDKKNQSLMRINADLDNFVHIASHDLLAPLSNIEISISVMNEMNITDPHHPELNRFLEIINTSVKKFRELLREIGTVARIESNTTHMEMVNLDDVISNIEWSLADKIKSSGAVIHKDIEVQEVLFSKPNLRSILYNLICNSIKYKGDSAPVIHIRSLKEQDNVLLLVQDNGIGIDKDDLPKIFNLYGRLRHDIEGQGIGLYLTKKIINAANGKLVVESEPGKGSTFTIYLKTEQEVPVLS